MQMAMPGKIFLGIIRKIHILHYIHGKRYVPEKGVNILVVVGVTGKG